MRLRAVGLGIEGLFGEIVDSVPASGLCEPCSPSDVGILLLNGLSSGSWATTAKVPRFGMRNLGNTCYVNSVAQVLVRTPAMLEWICRHNADGCPRADTGCVLCALFRTYGQLLGGGAGDAVRRRPVLAERRAEVSEVFQDENQHDVFEFFEAFIGRARAGEIQAGRFVRGMGCS